jgi:hypothetical protein
MDGNLLLEQYGKFKKIELKQSPFSCLLNTNIEVNPHQINAFCAAIQALKTGGIVLADEVGLGKTIEAGLTLKYVLNSGAKRVLIVLPATLRKQWEVELEEKFNIQATILDRYTVESNLSFWKSSLEKRDKIRIIITSYDYSSKLMQRLPNIKWDFIIIDEAHNLRNVFHGAKRAKRLYEFTKGIPKILLTATPLQNSLSDLHGLISYIDPRILGSEKVFNKKFIEGQDYAELKRELVPVLYRTLRRDVRKYIDFKNRECRTIDFALSPDEVELYMMVNSFLKKEVLRSIPTTNKGLIVMVIRKLLASSSYALIETFEILKNRLQRLYEGTSSLNAQEGFDLFWDFVEDEIDESAFDEIDDENILFQKHQIQVEMSEIDAIINMASRIKNNAKIKALKTAIHTAFEYQEKQSIPKKVVVFTESKRTQQYIAEELSKDGFDEDDVLLFNGDFNDVRTKEIYRAWQVKNFGKRNYGRSVEYKHAIVDYFKEQSKILIVTDAGSEGLNLQFCNIVINYDLPWNPQKIEQRIGRCHRYGQKNNVVAINLLNTTNEADRRIYEILSKKFELFDGVFGASDIALGTLESGSSFEKTILDIYQKCGTKTEFKKAFDRLDKRIDAKRNKKVLQLQSILMTASDIDKNVSLEKTNNDIKQYLKQVDFWSQVADSDVEGNLNYWKINNWGEKTFGSHGTLFIGAFCNSNNEMLFPVLLLCDEFGQYVDFSEEDIVRELETVDDIDIKYFKPTNEEIDTFKDIYNTLLQEMFSKYQEMTKPLRDYNKHKVENWVDIQREQLGMQIAELKAEIADLSVEEFSAKEFLRKVDIRKKIDEKVKQLQKLQGTFNQKVSSFLEEAEKEIAEFNHQFDIVPVLVVNVVLKF